MGATVRRRAVGLPNAAERLGGNGPGKGAVSPLNEPCLGCLFLGSIRVPRPTVCNQGC